MNSGVVTAGKTAPNMIIVNELRYILWHVVWMMSEDGLQSTVELREQDIDGEWIVYESVMTNQNILSGDAADAFNRICWEALSRGSRSMMHSHAANCGVEI